MRRSRATNAAVAGHREAQAIAATLGRDAAATRRRQGLTQATLAARLGWSRSRYADLERGEGASAPLELWVAIGMAIGRPLAVGFSKDPALPSLTLADEGHVAAQELVLRLAREHRRRADVELPLAAGRSSYSADVLLRDEAQRILLLIEVVNRPGDLGALSRATDRKRALLDGLAASLGGDRGSYRIAVGWLFVDSTANRRLVARWPEFIRARCPGSSAALAMALMHGSRPPERPAAAWIDPRRSRVTPMRLRTLAPT